MAQVRVTDDDGPLVDVITVREAAERRNVTPSAIYNAIRRGTLEAIRVDRCVFVVLTSFDTWNGTQP